MKKLLTLLLLSLAAGCATQSIKTVGIDPTLTWTAPGSDCTGSSIPAGSAVTYNVYIIPGPGPIPTTPTSVGIPCGSVDLAAGTPVNSAPITATTYATTLGNGQYTAGVEAILNGTRGPLISNTFTVSLSPKAATSLSVGP